MEARRETQDGPAVIKITGSIDAANAVELDQLINHLINIDTDHLVLFDCGSLEYVSSSGLRVFMLLLKKVRPRQGAVAFCGLNEQVQSIFEIAGLDALFTIRPTRDEALAALAGGRP